MTRRSPKAAKPARNTQATVADDSQRLQKVLAAAGLGSRRQCEELIGEGRVEVDGRVVTEQGLRVDRMRQEIRVDGVALHKPRMQHFLLNKPPGIVCTSRDPSGRPRVIDLVPQHERLFTVGRLDLSSEGLILVTNDGELANRLTHPRYGIEKTYHVEVAGKLETDELRPLRQGMHLAEGFAHAVEVRIRSSHKKSTSLEIVLDEGRNREIRRLLARLGHKVLRLKRVALGPLRLGELPPGHFRELTREEVRALRNAAPYETQAQLAQVRRAARKPKTASSRPRSVERNDVAPARKTSAVPAPPKPLPAKPPQHSPRVTEILVRPGPAGTRQGSVIGAELSAAAPAKLSPLPAKTATKRPSPLNRRKKPAKTRPPRGKQRATPGKRGHA